MTCSVCRSQRTCRSWKWIPVSHRSFKLENYFKFKLRPFRHRLPGYSALVSSAHVKEIAPVQYACETILFVNRELQQLASLHVMGGIEKYQEAFFISDFLANHANHLEHVFQLRQIVEQMRILDAGLTLHEKKLAPPEVQHCTRSWSNALLKWSKSTTSNVRATNKPGILHQQSRHTNSSPNVQDTDDSAPCRTLPRQIAPPLPPRSSKIFIRRVFYW